MSISVISVRKILQVAVKFLRDSHLPQQRRAFFREIDTLVKGLPGMVRLLDFNKVADPPYYVMEYLGGGTLTHYAGRLPEDHLLTLARGLANVLATFHSKCGPHGDYKPDNIFAAPDGKLKLGDPAGNGFGFSVLLAPARGGTPGYWAPEIQTTARSASGRRLFFRRHTLPSRYWPKTCRRRATRPARKRIHVPFTTEGNHSLVYSNRPENQTHNAACCSISRRRVLGIRPCRSRSSARTPEGFRRPYPCGFPIRYSFSLPGLRSGEALASCSRINRPPERNAAFRTAKSTALQASGLGSVRHIRSVSVRGAVSRAGNGF